jgi:arylsulfatase A-like enzyme
MNAHLILLALLAIWLPGVLPFQLFAGEQPATKPNIVFIIVDDLGYRNLGCYGGRSIQTPNIDAMCKEGMRFTDCYSGASVCAPARSTLMTGYHLGHAPVRGNSGGTPLFPEDLTVAEILKKAGYLTGGFGKWGLGNQGSQGAAEKQGFDTFFGYYNQVHAHDYYTSHLFRNSERVELNGPLHDVIANGEPTARKGRYSHYAIFDETLKFIKDSAASGKPFFCYAAWTPPHSNLVIPADDPAWGLYKGKEELPGRAKAVAAMNSMVDRHVGELLGLLEELKIDDNTIVFFTSDNGASRPWPGVLDSCGELKGFKGSSYEGGIRVPMVVRWPGKIKAGTVSDLPWYFPDVMPTLAELAGVSNEVPKDTDGISIVPTLLGNGVQKKHEYLFWSGAIRMGNWKGVGNPQKIALYDLGSDLGETNDVAKEHPDVVAALTDFMREAWTEPRSQESDGTYTGREEPIDTLGKPLVPQ